MALLYQPRDTIVVKQNVRILVRDGDHGRILREILTHNLVVDSGLGHIADILRYPDDDISYRGVTPNYLAVGTGTTAAAAGDTTLGNEVYRAEISGRTPQTNGIEWHLVLSAAEANDTPYYNLSEAGIFHVAAGGTLWGRCVHAAIEKSPSVSISYRWTWTFENA